MEADGSEHLFLDTLFVVALASPRDQYQAQARGLAETFGDARLLTTEAILLEIGNSLARSYKRQAVRILRELRESERVEIAPLTPELFASALTLYESTLDKGWGLIDCVSFSVMRQAGVMDALTFDRHFVQVGFRNLMTA
jgi:hypothetical protein